MTSPFTTPEVDEELNPGATGNLPDFDSTSSNMTPSKVLKERAEAKEKEKKVESTDATQTLKSAIVVSGVIVTVIGAIFAITKKLKSA